MAISLSGYGMRHDYETAVNAVSRLSLYAVGGGNSALSYEMLSHCQRLAKKDLKELSISLRRLIESTKLIPFTANLGVATGKFFGGCRNERVVIEGSTNLWDLLGTLVHVRSLDLFDQAIDVALALAGSNKLEILADRGHDSPQQIEASCLVRSDKKRALFFVGDFAKKSELALEAFEKCASSFGIELNADWLDDF
jgi:hypothetical protein